MDELHLMVISVWYAGAYTVQTNTVPLDTGREVPFAPPGCEQITGARTISR